MAPRIKNPYIRIPARVLLAALAVVLAWFAANRLLCPLWAVKVLKLETGSAGPEFRGRLRIATYNIARGCGSGGVGWQGDAEAHLARLGNIGRMLRDRRADLVVLNEVDLDSVWSGHVDQARAIARAGGFRHCIEQCNYDVAVPLARVRVGNAVLSRYPVRRARVLELPGYQAWETVLAGHKNALVCEVELSTDCRIALLAAHFEHRGEATRVAEARRIEAFRQGCDLPLVVAGDLNATLPGFPYAARSPKGENALAVLLGDRGYRTTPAARPKRSDLTFPA